MSNTEQVLEAATYKAAAVRPPTTHHENKIRQIRSTSRISSSLLLQQSPACLIRLIFIVFAMGGRWPYICCFRQIIRAPSLIDTELLYIGASWTSYLFSSMWRGTQEFITYQLAPTSPAVSRVSVYPFKWTSNGRTSSSNLHIVVLSRYGM